MKIAFSCNKGEVNEQVETRFGRCACFLIFDTDTGKWEKITNEKSMNSPQGAGIQAGSSISQHGVNVIVTGHVGPNAHRTLQAAGIKVFSASGVSIEEALKQYQSGTLSELLQADVTGHW